MAKKRKAKKAVKGKKAVKAKTPVKRKAARRAKKPKPMGTMEALVGTIGETSALRRRLIGRESFED